MKIFGFNTLKNFLFIITLSGVIYFSFLYLLPHILNSEFVLDKAKVILKKQSGMTLESQNLQFRTYPDMRLSLSSNELSLNDSDNNNLITVRNADIFYDLKHIKTALLDIDYIYIDESGFKDIIRKNLQKKATDFKLNFVPRVNINKIEIWVDKKDISNIYVILTDVIIAKEKEDITYCTFNAEVISALLQNILEIGNSGVVYVNNDGIFAKNLSVLFGTSELTVNGKIYDNKRTSDYVIKGSNLPVGDIEAALLYFLKLRKPGKQFMENFYDYDGNINIDLKVKNNGIFGKCSAENLSAKSVLFDVPVLFNHVFFDFNGREVKSEATGTLGGETVYNSFYLKNLATNDQEVTGHVNSVITDKLADKYIPETEVIGGADISVDYKVKNHIVNIDYLLKLGKKSDIIYKDAYMGRLDRERQILINTVKKDDKITVSNYEYSDVMPGKTEKIITGDGLFLKKNGKYTLDKVSMKTNGFVPATITGSFGKNVSGGFFSGDLKYDFVNRLLIGNFIVKDTKYKRFFVKEAKVDANKAITSITAQGTFKDAPFDAFLRAKSNFVDEIYVYEMLFHIKEFNINSAENFSGNKINKQLIKKIKEETNDLKLSIEKWTVKIDKIKRQRICLNNVVLTGSLKNEVFKFIMPSIKFADGILTADGFYNFKTKLSEIDFEANRINSDKVAGVVFNFPGQIEGIADAKIKTYADNADKKLKAFVSFKIDNGLLTKIGSTEFIIKKSKKVKRDFKFKLEDFISVDVKYMDALYSDLAGSFCYDNGKIKDAKITSKQKYFSYFLEGGYDTDSQYADFELLGVYNNKVQSKVKIFFIPLSLITKLFVKNENTYDKYKHKFKLIPEINSAPEEKKYIRVTFNGDLNNHPKVKIRTLTRSKNIRTKKDDNQNR